MPLLDPGSPVLSSPMLIGTFSVRRRNSTVSQGGRNKTSDTLIEDLPGVVYPSGNNSNDRTEDASTGFKSIEVISQFRLQSQVERLIPDIVLWRGGEFIVRTVDDYTPYGAGWIQATCTTDKIIDPKAGL